MLTKITNAPIAAQTPMPAAARALKEALWIAADVGFKVVDVVETRVEPIDEVEVVEELVEVALLSAVVC
jgi:hypothetical protein